jgi:mRNA-degrading endonuclease toxin of MazEF toxin-antitoxin module
VRCGEQRAVAVTDQIRSIAKERLAERMDTLSATDLAAVEDALRQILEL